MMREHAWEIIFRTDDGDLQFQCISATDLYIAAATAERDHPDITVIAVRLCE